jgi:putative endonuclease
VQRISGSAHPTEVSFYVYMAVDPFGSLHVGVTNDLARRLLEYRAAYPVQICGMVLEPARLVYYEVISSLPRAVRRQEQLRTWKSGRQKRLINAVNPEWRDLAAAG